MNEENIGFQPDSEDSEKRRSRRRQVLKRAQLIFGFGSSSVDCLILDESAHGLQVETAVMMEFPEKLRVRFSDGAIHRVNRLWTAGNRLGLAFVDKQLYDEVASRERKTIQMALKAQGFPAAMQLLRERNFFNDTELQKAAEAAEFALAKLSAMLD
jgi:hypothetical protein